ncbi:MAG: hypothetical protein IT294_00525 [Deltaproteobacteria bacterium]|nr:hypothetical protein [Deltaproteobacteria bacterium]
MSIVDAEAPALSPTRNDERPVELPGRVSIERNGDEYLVMINGAAFVALSRAQAEAIARRSAAGRDRRV